MSTFSDDRDALVYALSNVRHKREHAPRLTAEPDEAQRKHLCLLNDIALLLITKAKGDVAAVTLHQTSESITFYYAKNHQCEESMSDYLSNIRTIIATNGDLDDMQIRLLFEISRCCIEKFRSRVIKAKKELETCGDLTIANEDQHTSDPLSKHLSKWNGKSAQAIIHNYLEELRGLDTKLSAFKENLKPLIIASHEAYLIGRRPYLRSHPKLLARLQKLGAYFGATRRIGTLLKDPNFFNLRGSILFSEVRPEEPKTIQVPKAVADIINENAEKNGHELISSQDIADKFPDLVIATSGTATVTVSTHCELTLALHSFKNPTTSQPLEIGVSKRLCWLCQRFLESLEKHTVARFLVSEYQGKIHPGWAMPPETPEPVKEDICRLIEWEVHDIREQVIARRRSDSFPNSDREGTISETDLQKRIAEF